MHFTSSRISCTYIIIHHREVLGILKPCAVYIHIRRTWILLPVLPVHYSTTVLSLYWYCTSRWAFAIHWLIWTSVNRQVDEGEDSIYSYLYLVLEHVGHNCWMADLRRLARKRIHHSQNIYLPCISDHVCFLDVVNNRSASASKSSLASLTAAQS